MRMLRSLGWMMALVFGALDARATWIESGDVEIVVTRFDSGYTTQVYLEAEDVNPDDRTVQVSVGTSQPGGEVTVVGEGSITEPKVLGTWYVYEGEGNIQSVIGTVGNMNVGRRAGDGTIGVLGILNSVLEVGSLRVLNGTANVIGSRLAAAHVFEGSSLYASLGSRFTGLTTDPGSYTSIDESIVSSTQRCSLRSTVIVEDSFFRCREIEIATSGEFEADVDVRAIGVPSVTLEATDLFEVQSGDVDVQSAVVTTGALQVGGSNPTRLSIAASLWTNEGGTTVQRGGTVAPIRLVIGGGSRFHELELVRVAGHPGTQHLTVNGAGTELEIEGDLRIGETLNFQGNPVDIVGNATVSNDAEVIVHGTLFVREQGTLTIESGATVYAASVDGTGTITENGGTLVVPEASSTLGGVAAFLALFLAAHQRRLA